MRLKIRKLRVRMATNRSIEQLAWWLNPLINGWIGYYGRYNRSALYAMCRHVNKALVRWARRKYKPIRRHKVKAIQFLEGIAKQSLHLFVHWRTGMIGGFA
jgi:RNA-directed DNA polymerase